jgi:pimeloyl-ACP methyl ester carboxylesterase
LFIHGYPFDRTIWSAQFAALDGFRRIAPDLRGMGQSDAPDLGYSMATYADDLAALLDTLGIDAVILCGLSMGGYIAFEFLRRWRGRVRGLALLATRAESDSAEGRRGRDAAAAVARERGPEAIADLMLPQVLAPSTLANAPTVVERVRAMMAATPVPGIIGALAAMRDRVDSTPLLATLEGLPTLVAAGEFDQIIPPEKAKTLADAIPGSRYAVIEGAGHLPPVERPAATTQALLSFLATLR